MPSRRKGGDRGREGAKGICCTLSSSCIILITIAHTTCTSMSKSSTQHHHYIQIPTFFSYALLFCDLVLLHSIPFHSLQSDISLSLNPPSAFICWCLTPFMRLSSPLTMSFILHSCSPSQSRTPSFLYFSYTFLSFLLFSFLLPPYLTVPYLTLPYLTLPYLPSHHLTLPYLTLPYMRG